MDYRREIDGLRALAVLPVILFHAGFQTFSGGFVGVDVFFVISGYLITTIILNDLDSDKFSLIDFYERRARRILPALYLIVTISLVFAYLWMLPDELKSFGQSVVATAFSANNVLLTLTTGYWALAAEFKPLLHTWSLGVEEQYYVIVPLLLIACYRFFRGSVTTVLSLVFITSLMLSVYGAARFPEANFYLLPTRAWELTLGSFIAVYMKGSLNRRWPRAVNESASLIGFAAVCFAVLTFSSKTPTPSLYTLIPTLGAVLLIVFTRQDTLIYRVLASRLAVGVGLVSYSAYLWHWPLFAFARVYSVEAPSAMLMGGLSVLSLLLAVLTWRFVERPFRNRTLMSRRFIFVSASVSTVALAGAGFFLHKSQGFPERMFPAEVASGSDLYIAYNESAYRFKRNFDDSGRLRLLIAGDSFGRDFVNMIVENFDLTKFDLVYRNDVRPCVSPNPDETTKSFIAATDILVFAFATSLTGCAAADIAYATGFGKKIFIVGPKHFGANLNWLVRMPIEKRGRLYNPLTSDTLNAEAEFTKTVPQGHAISLLAPIVKGAAVPVTDEAGRLISADRAHLTKFGAQLIGREAIVPSPLGVILNGASSGGGATPR